MASPVWVLQWEWMNEKEVELFSTEKKAYNRLAKIVRQCLKDPESGLEVERLCGLLNSSVRWFTIRIKAVLFPNVSMMLKESLNESW